MPADPVLTRVRLCLLHWNTKEQMMSEFFDGLDVDQDARWRLGVLVASLLPAHDSTPEDREHLLHAVDQLIANPVSTDPWSS